VSKNKEKNKAILDHEQSTRLYIFLIDNNSNAAYNRKTAYIAYIINIFCHKQNYEILIPASKIFFMSPP